MTLEKMTVSDLELDWKQFHVPVLPQKLGHLSQMLVGVTYDVHDRQQLTQRHGELGSHPALGADLSPLLLHLIWLWRGSRREFHIFQAL